MGESQEENKTLTIADIADALGVSKTTVSRAISGKGRIGSETRERVLKYIDAHNVRAERAQPESRWCEPVAQFYG